MDNSATFELAKEALNKWIDEVESVQKEVF